MTPGEQDGQNKSAIGNKSRIQLLDIKRNFPQLGSGEGKEAKSFYCWYTAFLFILRKRAVNVPPRECVAVRSLLATLIVQKHMELFSLPDRFFADVNEFLFFFLRQNCSAARDEGVGKERGGAVAEAKLRIYIFSKN